MAKRPSKEPARAAVDMDHPPCGHRLIWMGDIEARPQEGCRTVPRAGDEADRDEAQVIRVGSARITRRKGEITRSDLKSQLAAPRRVAGRSGAGPQEQRARAQCCGDPIGRAVDVVLAPR